MEINPNWLKKIVLCKGILEDILEDEKFQAAGIIWEGDLVRESVVGSAKVELERITQKLKRLLTKEENSLEIPDDFYLNYSQVRIYFTPLKLENMEGLIWVMIAMDANELYFKRKLNRPLKKIKILLH